MGCCGDDKEDDHVNEKYDPDVPDGHDDDVKKGGGSGESRRCGDEVTVIWR